MCLHFFADDTNLYCSIKSLEQLLRTVERELTVLKKWFDINELSSNYGKTKFIIFHNRQIKRNKIKIMTNDRKIEKVNETRILGVIIDYKLYWKAHLNNVKTKVFKTIAILYKTKNILNQTIIHAILLLNSTIHNLLCGSLGTNKTNTNPVYKLQKKAIKISNGSDCYEPTNKIFIILNA